MMKRKLLLIFMVIFALAVTSANGDLVGHYEFDNPANIGESSAAGADASHQLTAYGDAAYIAGGKVGGALALDGSFDYLRYYFESQIPSGFPMGNSDFTTAAFFKKRTDHLGGIICIGEQATYQYNTLSTATGNVLGHITWGGDYSQEPTVVGTNLSDGQWHHAAITYDNAAKTSRLYLDGVEISFRTSAPVMTTLSSVPGAKTEEKSKANFSTVALTTCVSMTKL